MTIAALAALVVMAAPAYAQVKLAYVDVQKALNECDAGKRAKGEFQGRVQALESKLQRDQNEVQALKDELEKKGMLMKPDQRQNLEDQYMAKLKNFDREYKDSKDELQQKDNEVTAKIVHDLAQVIRQVGERDGYTMVFEKGSILWGSSGIDITDQVIRAYNSSHVKIGTMGMPEGAGEASYSPPPTDYQSRAPSSSLAEQPPPAAASAGASNPSDFGSQAAKRSTISK
jgi:outer membrane protein